MRLCPDTAERLGLIHDICYSNYLNQTGFNPIDDYEYLKTIDITIEKRMVNHISKP